MLSNASKLSINNKNKETSVSSSDTKSSLATVLNDLGDQKVSTSSPSIDSAVLSLTATAVTPMKSQEEIVLIIESEEENTLAAPSTDNKVVDKSKRDASAAVTTTIMEPSETDGDASKQNEDRNRLSNGINDLNSEKSRGPGRPSNKASSSMSMVASSAPSSSLNETSVADKTVTCTWCSEDKSILKYVLPTPNGDKQFCSTLCIAEFRKALKKGACSQCGNVVRSNVAPNRKFCSTFCMSKVQMSAIGRIGKFD